MNTKSKVSKKAKKYTESEIVLAFNLKRLVENNQLLNSWINTSTNLSEFELITFNKIIKHAKQNIDGWNEEELKMSFLAHILDLSNFIFENDIKTFFERSIEANIDNVFMKTKTDFMIAKGFLDIAQTPYFHFQEYKKDKDPNGDPAGQLLQAFLIAQEKNQNGKPMYGAYIIGRYWYFVVMQDREYCVSRSFDSTQEDGLMQIIAILRHFKVILETKLLVD